MKAISKQRSVTVRAALLTALAAGTLGLARPAAAQEACGGTTCPKGYSCETVPQPCPAIACEEGSECRDWDCSGTVEQCVAQPCDADSDCAADMVCLTRTFNECAHDAPACAPGAECFLPEPVDCTPTTTSACVPRWTLPCESAASCGAGFACVEQESCECKGSTGSGSSGMPAPAGGAQPTEPAPDAPAGADAPPSSGGSVPPAGAGGGNSASPGSPPVDNPSDCSCKPSGVSACEIIERSCTTDAECPSGWSCADNPEGVCWASSDGSTGCEPGDPPKLCLPPYRNLDSSGAIGRDEPANGGVATPNTPGDVAEPLPTAAPGESEFAEDSSTASPAAAEQGCSFGGSPDKGTSGLSLAALGALFAFSSRRRWQRRS